MVLGLLGSLVGGGKISKSILSTGLKVVDELYESDEEKKIAQRTLAEIDAKLKEKQIEVNIAEAKHKSLFVAGWRPFIGWISASALAFNFIVAPCMEWYIAFAQLDITLPNISLNELYPIILGMLGLGFARSYEKTKKVDDRH